MREGATVVNLSQFFNGRTFIGFRGEIVVDVYDGDRADIVQRVDH
jgi:hypothetical protein